MSTTKKTRKTTNAKTAESKVAETVDAVAVISKEAVDLAVKTSNDVTSKGYDKAVAVAKEQVEAASSAGSESFKGYEDVIVFHKNNFDALVEASSIWMNGVQDINNAWGKFASMSVEQGATSAKKLISCKTAEDALTVNGEAVKSSYDSAVVEIRNLNELSIKLAEKSTKPLAARVNETVSQFSKPIAA